MNKFFASQIKGETRFGDGKIGMRQRQARRQNRITTVGNIRKRPTVHESRHTFHRLHEIRSERITQDSEERTRNFQFPRKHRRSLRRKTKHNTIEPHPEIGQRFGEADDRHNLRGRRNIKSG